MDNGKKKLLMLSLLVIGCIITNLVRTSGTQDGKLLATDKNYQKQELLTSRSAKENGKEKKQQGQLLVQVSGAVVHPGRYLLPPDARAEEAILMAGGFLEDAASDRVNLARKLKDGVQIAVPFKKGNLSKTGAVRSSQGTDQGETKGYSREIKRVNINTASQQELEQLPGIGPAMAQRIISQRNSLPFQKVEDLLRVKGIGNSKLERLKEYISCN